MSDAPKNENKVLAIQRCLASGMNRTETAAKLGYSGWRSLDIFMRRSGLRWDGNLNRYLKADEPTETDKPEIPDNSSAVSRIIMLLNDINADPKQIAKKTGFADYREMASYMSARGYSWSAELNNYVKSPHIAPETVTSGNIYSGAATEGAMGGRKHAHSSGPARGGSSSRGSSSNRGAGPDQDTDPLWDTDLSQEIDMDRYIHLLDLLTKHKDRLLELLIPESYGRTIPRYFVPGITRTKSFYMSNSLSKLMNEFCRTRNLSQKEVIEAALIEFLSKYSFKKEVDDLIRGD